MSIKEISFASSNGRDTVKGWVYKPLDKPRAIVQLIHGFGEHSRRYLHMIGKFQDAGFVVYADDHIGHGKTANDSGTWGDPGNTKGFMPYLKDEHKLHDIAVQDYPDLPYFVFGHSWGSMLARGYAANYGQDIKGLMLCGVVAQMKGCIAEYRNPEFCAEIENGNGLKKDDGKWFGRCFLDMTERFDDATTPAAWIANDPCVVSDHAGDAFNCMQPTIQLLYDFVELHGYLEEPDWAANVPANVPCYLIAGDQDPCGNYGEGLYHVANQLVSTGHKKVYAKAYSGYRHEIHNERKIRDEVEQGLINFINGVLAE
jgi:Lysophospholipase